MSDMTFLVLSGVMQFLLFGDGAAAPRSAGSLGRGDDDAGHGAWVGDQRKVPRVDLGDVGAGPLGHEQLLGRRDHVVGGADQRLKALNALLKRLRTAADLKHAHEVGPVGGPQLPGNRAHDVLKLPLILLQLDGQALEVDVPRPDED